MEAVEARVFALLDAGDPRGAASVAIEVYGPAVFHYLSGTLDGDDALDVFQQWAEDVWRGLPGFRRECRLRTWAFKLARHAKSRFHRDAYQARRQRLPSSAASRLAVSVARSSAIATDARREQLRRLEAELPAEDRELLHLRHDRELSWEDTADILSAGDGPAVTAVALRKRYERIKDKLGRMARDAGLLE